jgi:ATP-dependent RNA helicase DeaD
VRERDQDRLLADPMWHEPVAENEADMVAKLSAQFSGEQIAAAYMRLYAARVSAPEELSSAGDNKPPKPRAPFGPSKWFSVNSGRNQGAEVRRLLPILCNAGNVTKDDVGAIRIQNDETFIELSAAAVAGFKSSIGSDMKVEGGLIVSELASPPAAANSPRPAYGGKPKGKPSGKPYEKKNAYNDGGPRMDAPKPPRKPKEDYAPKADAAPKAEYAPKPKPSSAPVVYDDAPAPKARKPKPADRPAKSAGHPASKRFEKPRSTMDKARDDGAVTERKPRGYSSDKPTGKPSGKPYAGKPKGGKNLAPAVGKPNSKKNKARAAAAKGGSSTPRRKD